MVRLKFDEPIRSRLLAFERILGDGNAVKNVLLLLLFLEIDMDFYTGYTEYSGYVSENHDDE